LSDTPVSTYRLLPHADILSIIKSLEVTIDDFLNYTLGYGGKIEYTVCALDLLDVIIRVDKRQHYFKVFHNNMNINEGKKAALFAYWIAKLRPIKVIGKHMNTAGYNDTVNELFAIHYLISALCGIGRIHLKDEHGGVELSLDNPFIERLRYSLRFRSLPIDSMIVLADSITTDSFKEE